MSVFKHILACLDLTEIDENIISYARFVSKVLDVKKITFFHVVQAYDIPENEKGRIGWFHQNLRERLQQKLKSQFDFNIKQPQIEIKIAIENRDASDVIINYVRREDVDLTIVGKKAETDRKELYSARIIALAESDVLLVPENPPLEINTVVSAIDFSSKSVKAFEVASNIALMHNARLTCHYLFSNPPLFFPVADDDSLLSTIEKKGEKKAKKFIKKHAEENLEVNYTINPVTYSKQGWALVDAAKKNNASIILVGARGRVSSTATLLGYIGESLRRFQTSIPILIFKNSIEKNSLFNVFLHG